MPDIRNKTKTNKIMKKNLFFAALAAMTLSLGFTACSDDDDNNGNNNQYSEVYRLRFSNDTNDDQAITTIYNNYRKAINLTDNTVADTILVRGKDSADCAKKFSEMMTNAEKTLSNMTFDGTSVVKAFESDNDCVYNKTYGSTENGTRYYIAQMFKPKDNISDTEEHVSKFKIELYSNWFTYFTYNDTDLPRYTSSDFCEGTGADYLQISAYPGNKNNYVNDVMVYVCQENETEPESFTFEDMTYIIAKGDVGNDKEGNINLNNGVKTSKGQKAPRIYLYYSSSRYDVKPRRLLIKGLAKCYSYDSGKWYESRVNLDCSVNDSFKNDTAPKAYPKDSYTYEFVKGVGKDASGNIVMLYPEGVNFNLGSNPDGYHLYLRTVYEYYKPRW